MMRPRSTVLTRILYNRWKRWGAMGICVRMMDGLSAQKAPPLTIMIEATSLKVHRTASSLRLKKRIQAA